MITKEELLHLYVEEENSIVDVANILGKSRQNVSKYLKEYNIPVRKRGFRLTDSKADTLLTNEFLQQEYVNKKKTAKQIAEENELTQTMVLTRLKRYEIEIRSPKGENHGMWNGGRALKGDGYIGIMKPEHPRADNQGYVYEHTLVMEEMIGRLPEGTEQVHHINCDKHDNRPPNLFLCASSKEHKKAHWSMEWLIKDLINTGVVDFNRDKGEYVLTESFKREKGLT